MVEEWQHYFLPNLWKILLKIEEIWINELWRGCVRAVTGTMVDSGRHCYHRSSGGSELKLRWSTQTLPQLEKKHVSGTPPSSSKTPNNALAMMGILFESSDVNVKMCLKVLFTLTVQSHHIFCNKQFDLFNFMCKQHDRNTLNLYVETVRKTVTFWRKLWIVFAVPLIVNV